jgi:acyl carrier protein
MQDTLREIFLNVLEIDEVSEDDSVRTIHSWDSVKHLALIMAIEDRLGLTFETDEIAGLTSVRAISEAVRRQSRQAG